VRLRLLDSCRPFGQPTCPRCTDLPDRSPVPAPFFEEFPLPAIAHVIVDQTLLHYMVIHKITKKEITVADPAKGIVKYTPEEFFQIWTGVLILLVPAPTFKKGDDTKGLFSRFFHLLIPQKKLLLHIFFASIIYKQGWFH